MADIHCYDDNSSYSLFHSSAKARAFKIKAVVLAFLIFGMIVATIGSVSVTFPPRNENAPATLDVVANKNADKGLEIAESHAPPVVPPPHPLPPE